MRARNLHDAIREQFADFPMALDFAVREIRTKIGTKRVKTGSRKKGYRIGDRNVFGTVDRTPTQKEAILAAFAESKRVEGIFDQIFVTNQYLAETVRGMREEQAMEALRLEQKRIANFAIDLKGHANEATIGIVRNWLSSKDGEFHLNNRIAHVEEQRESKDRPKYRIHYDTPDNIEVVREESMIS